MKTISKISTVAGATAILALVLSGCSAGDDAAVESPSPVPSASEYVPVPSDRGSQIVAAFPDCAAIGGLFGEEVSATNLQVDSVSPTGIFCDWGPAGEATVYGVQLDVEEQVVPGAEGFADENVTIIEDSAVSAAGGIIYSVQSEDSPSYVRIILPEAAGVFTYTTGDGATFVEPLKQLMIIE